MTTPLHLAIIPDGNRRWAQKNALKPWKGHQQSAENFREIIEWCCHDPRINILTIWCFSTENWQRDAEEVTHLMAMLVDYLKAKRPLFMKNKIRLLHSGRRDRFTPELTAVMDELIADTATHEAFTLHLAIDYGGKDEIIRTLEKISPSTSSGLEVDVSDAVIRQHLDQPDLPDIDLIIRTSGECRTSNFFLWQSTYSEWMFPQKLFPDFTTADINTCLKEFTGRSRRFGG